MNNTNPDITGAFQLGDIEINPTRSIIRRSGEKIRVEPKVMDLLLALKTAEGGVVSRQTLEDQLWPDVIVNEDTLARTISKLRRALGDTAKEQRFIETIPKRGYLLKTTAETKQEVVTDKRNFKKAYIFAIVIAGLVTCLLLWSVLKIANGSDQSEKIATTSRADDLYSRYGRAENEAAIELYERVLATDPDYAPAQTGLSNALVQRVIRWSEDGALPETRSVRAALANGRTATPEARATLQRAALLAEQSVRANPSSSDALKSLGFSYSALGRLSDAKSNYEKAAEIDPNAWDAMVNLGEIYLIETDNDAALGWFERAYEAMEAHYESEPQRIGSWLPDLGVVIGQLYETQSDPQQAEIWYRRVLGHTPLYPEATERLAHILSDTGREEEARTLCQEFIQRMGQTQDCLSGE